MTVAEWSHVALGTFSPHGSACVVRGSLCHGFSECLCLRFSQSRCTGVWQESKITSTLTKLRQRTVLGGRAIHVGHIVSLWPVNYPGGQLRFGALASSMLSVTQSRIAVVAQVAFQSFSAEANYSKSLCQIRCRHRLPLQASIITGLLEALY